MVKRDAEHWRNRAADARARADTAGDAWIRVMLIELANRCDELASSAEPGGRSDRDKEKPRH
jgi:hypothetical protein